MFFGCQNLLNFTCLPMKFHNCNHTNGRTAFHKACHPYDIGCWCSDSHNSQFQMVEFLIQKSKEFEIDLNATDHTEHFFLTGHRA